LVSGDAVGGGCHRSSCSMRVGDWDGLGAVSDRG
jgi:hypothetical protein